jgi:hypothetical protein
MAIPLVRQPSEFAECHVTSHRWLARGFRKGGAARNWRFRANGSGDSEPGMAVRRRPRASRVTPPLAGRQRADYLLFALRYAAMTEPATLPRSLTARPFSRAQARTAALLGRPSPTETERGFDLPERAAALAAADRGFFDPDNFRVCPSVADALVATASTGFAACWSPVATSLTSYIAPRTRIASSRGSLESRVIFTAVAFQHTPMRQPPTAREPQRYK